MSDLGFTAILIGLFLFVALVLRGLQRWLDRPRIGRIDPTRGDRTGPSRLLDTTEAAIDKT